MESFTLTEAKAKLSELISRVHFGKEQFAITRKGKIVALVSPASDEASRSKGEGLIRAKNAFPDLDEVIDELMKAIYANRNESMDRKVDL